MMPCCELVMGAQQKAVCLSICLWPTDSVALFHWFVPQIALQVAIAAWTGSYKTCLPVLQVEVGHSAIRGTCHVVWLDQH
jgi:hypothetical protein